MQYHIQHKITEGTSWINLPFKKQVNTVSQQTHNKNKAKNFTCLHI